MLSLLHQNLVNGDGADVVFCDWYM